MKIDFEKKPVILDFRCWGDYDPVYLIMAVTTRICAYAYENRILLGCRSYSTVDGIAYIERTERPDHIGVELPSVEQVYQDFPELLNSGIKLRSRWW
jgi:hypothetical protein